MAELGGASDFLILFVGVWIRGWKRQLQLPFLEVPIWVLFIEQQPSPAVVPAFWFCLLQEVHTGFLPVDLRDPLGCISEEVSSINGSGQCVQSLEDVQMAGLSRKVSCGPAHVGYQAGSGSILYQEM